MRCIASLIATHFATAGAYAYTELEFPPDPIPLSPPSGAHADKVRLVRFGDGTLVAAWQEAAGPVDGAWSIDGTTYAPRDILLRVSGDDGATWSDAINVSNTANATDPGVLYDRIGDGSGLAPYYGDSDKPNLFAVGSRLVVSWSDAYCGPGVHGPAVYEGPLGDIELPFHCLYLARLTVAAGAMTVVGVDRLTDAARDASQEVVRGTAAGFAAIWQEDPLGLQPGEAEGEGDGASGARVTEGTDIWWTALPMASFGSPQSPWSAPIPISDNYDYANDVVQGGGSSRPQFALVGNPALAGVVYEERKNVGAADFGKYVIYQQFPFAAPLASQPGTIVSDTGENGRRARVVAQGAPGSATGIRMLLLWRQGIGQHGAPSDVMIRIGRVPVGTSIADVPEAGLRVQDLWPAVDPIDASSSAPPLNLTSADPTDSTSALPDEDAKAHRAVLDGDFVFAGYTQNASVSDPNAAARYLVRQSNDGGITWSAPQDVSSGVSGGVDVIEPRLVRTPATVNSGNAEDVRDPDVYALAWGTGSMATGGSVEGDLYVTRTSDRGVSYERVQRLRATGDVTTFTDEAIQLAIKPDGRSVFAVWIRRIEDDATAMFNTAAVVERRADLSLVGTTGTPTADLGASVTASFLITNEGPDAATGLTITLAPDAALATERVIPGNGSCSGTAPVVCEFDPLPNGGSVETAITMSSVVAGAHSVVAQAAALEVEPNPANNVATVSFDYVPKADLAVALVPSVSVIKKGRNLTLEVTVRNRGPQPATNVLAHVTLPANLQIRSAPGCIVEFGDLSCALASLADGQSWSTTVELLATAKGAAQISATVTADEVDPVLTDNFGSVQVGVRNSGSGGCSIQPDGEIDPSLLLLLVGALGQIWRRRVRAAPAA